MRPSRDRVILIVEDDPELRTLYRTTLRAAGYAVFAVDDGIDALEYVEQTLPAAVVLDLGLPRLNGRDVQREMAATLFTGANVSATRHAKIRREKLSITACR